MISNSAFPHRYEIFLDLDETAEAILSAGPRPALRGGPPPEFGGRGDWWSPEHLLVASAVLCFWSTFQSVAAKSKLLISSFHCRAEGTLDKTPEGVAFTGVALEARLEVRPGDEERAGRLLETAKRHCIVSNSLKHPVALKATIGTSAPAKGAVA